jgi:hypothetical protein
MKLSIIEAVGSVLCNTISALNGNKAFLAHLEAEYPFADTCLYDGEFHLWYYPGTAQEIQTEVTKQRDSKLKFPALFLYLPNHERMTEKNSSLTLNLAIVGATHSTQSAGREWISEYRDRYVFQPLLNPVYEEFMRQLSFSKLFITGNKIPHSCYSVPTTGGYADDYTAWGDFVDYIRLLNVELTVNPHLCDKDILKAREEYELLNTFTPSEPKPPIIQDVKTVEITEPQNILVKPDAGSYAMKSVYVKANIDIPTIEPVRSVLVDANGKQIITPSDGFDALKGIDLDVNVPTPLIEPAKSLEIVENGTVEVLPSAGFDGMQKLTIVTNIGARPMSLADVEVGFNFRGKTIKIINLDKPVNTTILNANSTSKIAFSGFFRTANELAPIFQVRQQLQPYTSPAYPAKILDIILFDRVSLGTTLYSGSNGWSIDSITFISYIDIIVNFIYPFGGSNKYWGFQDTEITG